LWHDVKCAAAVTTIGQNIINTVKEGLANQKDWGLVVVQIDTDGIWLLVPPLQGSISMKDHCQNIL
jgi:DNA polymerase elongation subunit (family B)